ncbi:MAG: PLAT/LH2 domain-containing protein [Polyangia bacterium]
MRYRWKIKTSDSFNAGTDADVFLSLAGTDAAMREVEITDPGAINDWERGDVNSGIIETDDLGELQSGTLRHNNSGAASGWSVDWVKVQNEEDGREWTATVGKFDEGGRFPLLRFALTDPGQYEQIQKQKQREAQARADKDAKEKKSRAEADEKQKEEDEEAQFQKELDAQNKQLERELKRVKLEAELAKKKAEIDKLKNGGASSAGPGVPPMSGGSTFRTYELFGVLNGVNVPLAQVVICDRATGRCSVVPGGRVIVGEQPNEGFGLGGVPGRWSLYYGGRSPAEFGLDPDKGVLGSDGSRGWVLTAQFLSQVLGGGWRAAIYS